MLLKEICDQRFNFFWDINQTKYDYGEDGIRLTKTTPSQITLFIDKYTELRGSDVVRHIYANDKLIASIDEINNTTYNHPDHLGSSNLKTDSVGSVIKRIEYAPFGDKRAELGIYNNIKNRFTGQYEDEESDLYYYQQRYYDPILSRFITADPLYLEEIDKKGFGTQHFNFYSYVENNPISKNDPNGLIALRIGGGFSASAYYGGKVEYGLVLSWSKENGFQFGGYSLKGATVGATVGTGIYGTAGIIPSAKTISDVSGISGGTSFGGGVLGRYSLGVSSGVGDDGTRINEYSVSRTLGPSASFGMEGEISNIEVSDPWIGGGDGNTGEVPGGGGTPGDGGVAPDSGEGSPGPGGQGEFNPYFPGPQEQRVIP